jgi:hypothetical protein
VCVCEAVPETLNDAEAVASAVSDKLRSTVAERVAVRLGVNVSVFRDFVTSSDVVSVALFSVTVRLCVIDTVCDGVTKKYVKVLDGGSAVEDGVLVRVPLSVSDGSVWLRCPVSVLVGDTVRSADALRVDDGVHVGVSDAVGELVPELECCRVPRVSVSVAVGVSVFALVGVTDTVDEPSFVWVSVTVTLKVAVSDADAVVVSVAVDVAVAVPAMVSVRVAVTLRVNVLLYVRESVFVPDMVLDL